MDAVSAGINRVMYLLYLTAIKVLGDEHHKLFMAVMDMKLIMASVPLFHSISGGGGEELLNATVYCGCWT